MTTSTATSLSEEFAESTVEGSGGTKLKRASSWKKFKDTVKGWVGQPGAGQEPHDASVPSAVNPGEDVTRATTCVNTVLRNTNCYSGTGGATLPQSSPPRHPQVRFAMQVQRSSIDTLVKRHDSNIVDVSNAVKKGENLEAVSRLSQGVLNQTH